MTSTLSNKPPLTKPPTGEVNRKVLPLGIAVPPDAWNTVPPLDPLTSMVAPLAGFKIPPPERLMVLKTSPVVGVNCPSVMLRN